MSEIKCIQGSGLWYCLRKGIPTASAFDRIIQASPCEVEVPIDEAQSMVDTPGRLSWDGIPISRSQEAQLKRDCDKPRGNRKYARFTGYKPSASWDTYAAELLASLVGWESGFKGTPDTEYGIQMEGKARSWLELTHKMDVHECGFFMADCGLYGASPDGTLDDGTPVEIKCPDTHTFLKWKFKGTLPDDHKAQVHGEMLATGASRCIFVAYNESGHLEPMMIEVQRDDFTDALDVYLRKFCAHLDALRTKHFINLPELLAKLEAEKQAALRPPEPPENEHLPQLMTRLARKIRTEQNAL